MNALEIRAAVPDDIEAAVGVWERARWQAEPWLEKRMNYTHEDNLRHFRDVVLQESELWLAVDEGKIVGLLALGEETVDQLYVDPPCQRRGIGTKLLIGRKSSLQRASRCTPTSETSERARSMSDAASRW